MNCVSWRSLFLIWLPLSFFWVPLSQGHTCSSTSGDESSSCTRGNLFCKQEHSDQKILFCGNLREIGSADKDHLEICEESKRCSSNSGNLKIPLSYNKELNPITLHALDIKFFAVHVSWHHQPELNVSYEVRIWHRHFLCACICVGSDQKSVYIGGNEQEHRCMIYVRSAGSPLTVEVLPQHDNGESFKMTQHLDWPTSCLDIYHNSSTCGSPVLHAPYNITATEICNSDNFTVHLQWDNDYDDSFPSPSHYYITVFLENVTQTLFRFVANGTTSVEIQFLEASYKYVFTIQPYSYCSGIANFSNYPSLDMGCGIRSKHVYLQTAFCPLPTDMITTTLSNDDKNKINHEKHILVYGCSSASILFIIVIFMSLCFIMRRCCSTPSITNSPPFRPAADLSVFVVHAPKLDDIIDIQKYIVCPLSEFFSVTTSGDRMCGDIIEWFEVQVRKSNAVVLVFTKEFSSEWEEHSNKSHEMRATQRLLMSAVAQEHLDKYTIVVLHEDMKKCIPNNHYLQTLKLFVLGKRKNEIDALYRCITKTRSFEHPEIASTCVPISTISSSDDEK